MLSSKIDLSSSLKKLATANAPVRDLDEGSLQRLATLLKGSGVSRQDLQQAAEILPLVGRNFVPVTFGVDGYAKRLGLDAAHLTPAQTQQLSAYSDAIFDIARDMKVRLAELDTPGNIAKNIAEIALTSGVSTVVTASAIALNPVLGAAALVITGTMAAAVFEVNTRDLGKLLQ
jgi:hypothetical protein